jgi:hypothetical protein
MSDYDIHSCGYYCDRPACIKTQRDELRDKLFSDQVVKTYSGGKPNYTQPIEPKLVAWMWDVDNGGGYSSRGIGFQRTNIPFAKQTPLYTIPPQREWVGLTEDELSKTIDDVIGFNSCVGWEKDFARVIEAKLKEKNT